MIPLMHVSADGIAVLKFFEGLSLRATPDPETGGAPWTAGYGATGQGIDQNTVWTQLQADNRLCLDLGEREADACQAIGVPMRQGMFDAFCLLLFNVGHGSPARDGIIRLRNAYPSTLLRMLNQTNYLGARSQFSVWVDPTPDNPQGLHGLRRRRRAEMALWDGLNGAQAIIIGEAMP